MTEPQVVQVTPAERAVIVELAADGASNREIADRLSITHWTVKSHLMHVMKRSGHSSRTALAVAMVRGRLKLRVVTYGIVRSSEREASA